MFMAASSRRVLEHKGSATQRSMYCSSPHSGFVRYRAARRSVRHRHRRRSARQPLARARRVRQRDNDPHFAHVAHVVAVRAVVRPIMQQIHWRAVRGSESRSISPNQSRPIFRPFR
jgi:hypothetical protein